MAESSYKNTIDNKYFDFLSPDPNWIFMLERQYYSGKTIDNPLIKVIDTTNKDEYTSSDLYRGFLVVDLKLLGLELSIDDTDTAQFKSKINSLSDYVKIKARHVEYRYFGPTKYIIYFYNEESPVMIMNSTGCNLIAGAF